MKRIGRARVAWLSSWRDAVTLPLAGRVDGLVVLARLLSLATCRPFALAALLVPLAASGASAYDSASFVSYQDLPASMTTGETATVGVKMLNTGRSTWTSPTGYKLVSLSEPSDLWGIGDVALPDDVSVDANGSHTFTFSIAAPATPGDYVFKWRMDHDGTGFGKATTSRTISVTVANTAPVVVLAIDDMTLTVGGRSETVNLSSHFEDAENGTSPTLPHPPTRRSLRLPWRAKC